MSSVLLYFNTIRHLRWSQFIHLLWFRFFKKHIVTLKKYQPTYQLPLNLHSINSLVYPIETTYHERTGFVIFQKSKRFDGKPDWTFQNYGKLWNYHLQYLEILMDETLVVELRQHWLTDLSQKLVDGTFPMEPFPVSMRIIYSLQFLSKHPTSDPLVISALQKQVAFLEGHLEKHLSGNHLLENYQTLVFAFMAFNETSKLNTFLRCLLKELDEQILDDGAHYELCLSYHAAIFCRLAGVIHVLRKSSVYSQTSAILAQHASHMYGWLKAITRAFKVYPLINDSVQWPEKNYQALQQLAIEMGLDGKVLALAGSGYRWIDSGSLQLFMRVGPFMVRHQPGHQHADYLSICLYLDAIPILVDPGISTYEEGDERLDQKGTSRHNLVVERFDENQSELWSSFRMARRAKVNCIIDRPDELTAYCRWYQGHMHKRGVEKVTDGLLLHDSFESGKGKNQMAVALFHFDEAVGEIRQSGDQVHLVKFGLRFHFLGSRSITKESYQQHFGFNDSRKAERILVYFCGQLKTKIHLHP